MSFSIVGTALAGAAASAVVSHVMAPSAGSGTTSVSGGAAGATNPGAAAAADPFAAQRGQYQTQLNTLMTNPSSVASTPGYQFQLGQIQNATQAQDAAKGIGSSGANDAALQANAAGLASQTYQQDFNNLAMLSGANINGTAGASQAITAGNNTANAAIGTVAGAVGTGVKNLLGSGGPSSDGSVTPVPTGVAPSTTPTAAPATFQASNPWGGSSGGSVGFSGYGS